MKNHYRTLGVANFSSSKEVQIAFRALAVKYHPDKHQGSTIYENKFKIVNEAYQILSDPSRKAIYDQQLLYYTTPSPALSSSKRNTTRNTTSAAKEYKSAVAEKAVYTKFQEGHIKYAYGIPIVFFVIVVLAGVFSKNESPITTFNLRAQELVANAQLSIDMKEFEKAESEIALIYTIESNSYAYDRLVEQFCEHSQTLAELYYEKKDYANCLKTFVLHERMSDKSTSASTSRYTNFLMIIESGVETNQKNLVREYVDGLYRLNITDYKKSFHLVDVLLSDAWIKEGADLSNYLMNSYINFMINRYGLMYKEMMTGSQFSDDFKKQVAQYVYLNYSSPSAQEDRTNLEVMKDLLKDQLVSEEEKKIYYELLFVDFNPQKFSAKLKDLKTPELEYLKEIKMYEYYRSLK